MRLNLYPRWKIALTAIIRLSVPDTDEVDSNWSTTIPDPIDSFDEENRAFDNVDFIKDNLK